MKIGEYVIPENRLGKLLTVIKRIYDEIEDKEVSSARVADFLKLSLTGGGFNGKMQDLESYGLIEREKGMVRVTELGQRVTYYRNDVEKNSAILEAVKNIELWKKLLEKVGPNVTQANFWYNLEVSAVVDRSVAKKKAEKVMKAYLKDVALIKSVGEPKGKLLHSVEKDTRLAGGAPNMHEQTSYTKTASVTIEHALYKTSIVIEEGNYDAYSAALDMLKLVKKSLNISEADVSYKELLNMLNTINLALKQKEEREQAASQNKGENEEISSSATQKREVVETEGTLNN